MVAIKAAHIPLFDRDLWAGLPWEWGDEHRIRSMLREQLIEQGVTEHPELYFAEARAWQHYMQQFPRYGERQKIVRRIQTANKTLEPKKSNIDFTYEEVRYLVDKLFGVNDDLGYHLKQKLGELLK